MNMKKEFIDELNNLLTLGEDTDGWYKSPATPNGDESWRIEMMVRVQEAEYYKPSSFVLDVSVQTSMSGFKEDDVNVTTSTHIISDGLPEYELLRALREAFGNDIGDIVHYAYRTPETSVFKSLHYILQCGAKLQIGDSIIELNHQTTEFLRPLVDEEIRELESTGVVYVENNSLHHRDAGDFFSEKFCYETDSFEDGLRRMAKASYSVECATGLDKEHLYPNEVTEADVLKRLASNVVEHFLGNPLNPPQIEIKPGSVRYRTTGGTTFGWKWDEDDENYVFFVEVERQTPHQVSTSSLTKSLLENGFN